MLSIIRLRSRCRGAVRVFHSVAAAVARREPKDLHAAWASLACYDSEAVPFLNPFAETAKTDLESAGYVLTTVFAVDGGKATSFDGNSEVDETDVANLWVRESDGRGILAFRGSDTQEDLEHVRSPDKVSMYGHQVHAGVQSELAPLLEKMSPSDFASLNTLAVTGHSLGGGCASLFAVLVNDGADPLQFGQDRKLVDELYGFGATPVFHSDEAETANDYGCGHNQTHNGSFKGAIYRALKKNKDGTESQDRAFNLATQNFHYPKTNLVNLESATTQPVAFPTSRILGAPGWR